MSDSKTRRFVLKSSIIVFTIIVLYQYVLPVPIVLVCSRWFPLSASVPILIHYCKQPNSVVRCVARSEICRLRSTSLTILLERLRSKDINERRAVASLIDMLAQQSELQIHFEANRKIILLEMLNDPDKVVQVHCARALLWISKQPSIVYPIIENIATSEDVDAAYFAIETLEYVVQMDHKYSSNLTHLSPRIHPALKPQYDALLRSLCLNR